MGRYPVRVKSVNLSASHLARLLGSAAAAMLAISFLLVTPTALPAAAADGDCTDVEVIFARGTSEAPGIGRVGAALVDALRQQTSQNIGVYAVNYPAGRLQLGGGDGANDTINRVKFMADKCPETQLVLGGYSQGASVMDIVTGTPVGINWGSSLPAEYADNVVAVAVFGNAANRMGGPISSQSALFASKAIDLCNPGDPICHEGEGNDWKDHTDGYIPVYTNQAAAFVAGKLAPSHLTPEGFIN
ncbi:cutinase family protein [Mycobacterium koreense]|uniref:Cutinase n=2 Tax=Mycolicibacillus koreensis TaxID=1069220 RepID=A0AA91PHR4_9MYCO|nr:cutinase family protein [Mycolicibacillus koreensis]OSC35844.1 cutinase [Mycolicibacillus koreensis]